MVVIAIIAILAALILPVVSIAREHARRNACSTNLQKIGAAVQLYYQDQGGYPADMWEDGGPGLSILLGSATVPAYLSDVQDLHCPDNLDTNTADLTTTTHVGYDNYDGPDLYGQSQWPTVPGSVVSAAKYSRTRLDKTAFTAGYSDPDYTRQLLFLHPDANTVVTWCDQHRPVVGGIYTPDSGKNDLVLFLDGKVMPKTFEPFSTTGLLTHPVTGNGLRLEATP
jgi:type II secretory pathway pseudopilin PulG